MNILINKLIQTITIVFDKQAYVNISLEYVCMYICIYVHIYILSPLISLNKWMDSLRRSFNNKITDEQNTYKDFRIVFPPYNKIPTSPLMNTLIISQWISSDRATD